MAPKLRSEALSKHPPGDTVLKVIDKYRVTREIAKHIALRQIIDDAWIEWNQAGTAKEKIAVHKRFRVQVIRSMLSFGGFEIAAHGVISVAFGNFLVGGSLIVVGAAMMHLMRR